MNKKIIFLIIGMLLIIATIFFINFSFQEEKQSINQEINQPLLPAKLSEPKDNSIGEVYSWGGICTKT